MKDKRGEGEWTLSKVVSLVLLLVLFVLLVVGVGSGKFLPLIERVGGYADSTILSLGLFNRNTGIDSTEECFNASAAFTYTLEDGNDITDNVLFSHCFRGNEQTCHLETFTLGASNYTYRPLTKQLSVERLDGLGAYTVNFNERTTADDVYYEGIRYMYSLFNDGGDTRDVDAYDIEQYIALGMDHYFGQFGDLFIMYGKEKNMYFMEANGRFLVADGNRFSSDGLDSWNRYYFGQEVATASPAILTPIIGASSLRLNGILYRGTNRDTALRAFSSRVDTINDDNDIQYVICKPKPLNRLYNNCWFTDDEDEHGTLDKLLDWIYVTFKDENPSLQPKSQGNDNQLDEDHEVALIAHYLEDRRQQVEDGIMWKENVADEIDQLVARHSSGGMVTINGIAYEVSASRDGSTNLPLILFTPQDATEKTYFFRFNGVQLYRDGETDFFLSQGNQIRPPFEMFELDPQTNLSLIHI